MAADVQQTPTLRKDYSQNFGDSVNKKGVPFRATQIWNKIIDHLKENVEVKRRKLTMKSYDHCFTGADAVDVILNQLLTDKDNFPNKEITRDKATKLCQFMLEQEIFQAVRGHKTDDKAVVFEDSNSKLYRFSKNKENNADNMGCHSCQELSKPDLVTSEYPVVSASSGKSTSSMSSLLHRHQGVVQELLELTGTWRRRNSDAVKRKLTPLHLFTATNTRLSLPAAGLRNGYGTSDNLDGLEKLTPEVEDELMREHALSQLLTLLDIPILDNILSYEAMMAKATPKRMAYSNLAFTSSDSLLSVYSAGSDKEDPWWCAAVECVCCIPKSTDILDESLEEHSDLTQKLRIYQSIADYYASAEKPMWSESFVDIHVGLLNLLMQGRRDQVFKGLCLAVILLPNDIQRELKRLLRFLHQAVSDDAVSLSSSEDNRSTVARVFTPVVIKSKMLTPHQASQLVLFMVDHAENLWEPPDEVEEAVRKSLLELQEGKDKQMALKTYCSQVSKEEFKRQQEQLTEQSLVDMLHAIIDSTKISVKDKKKKLKLFQKHHPAIYLKHFADLQ